MGKDKEVVERISSCAPVDNASEGGRICDAMETGTSVVIPFFWELDLELKLQISLSTQVWKYINTIRDCDDGSDETQETCGTNCEKVGGRFACSDGKCIGKLAN